MLEEKIKQNFKEAVEILVDKAKMEILQQGHKASGKLIESLVPEFTLSDLRRLVAYIWVEDYGLIVDQGVKAARVPYSGRSQAPGGRSAYIEGLLNWARIVKPGLADKERLSFVFAVAATHKKEGIPSRGSFSFSQNGRRKNWVKYGIDDNIEALERDLELFNAIRAGFDQALLLAA